MSPNWLNGGRRYRVLFADDSFDGSAVDEINVTVPDRSVFVLGDNRDRSKDSRHIGSSGYPRPLRRHQLNAIDFGAGWVRLSSAATR